MGAWHCTCIACWHKYSHTHAHTPQQTLTHIQADVHTPALWHLETTSLSFNYKLLSVNRPKYRHCIYDTLPDSMGTLGAAASQHSAMAVAEGPCTAWYAGTDWSHLSCRSFESHTPDYPTPNTAISTYGTMSIVAYVCVHVFMLASCVCANMSILPPIVPLLNRCVCAKALKQAP